jgi:MoaA/NifB/PqqE/SkfB family radical SAM enzyme
MDKEFPESLQIEVTNKCNFNCLICMRHVWKAKPCNMSLNLYKAIAETAFPRLSRLILRGLGEPFTNFNSLEMLKISRNHLPGEA